MVNEGASVESFIGAVIWLKCHHTYASIVLVRQFITIILNSYTFVCGCEKHHDNLVSLIDIVPFKDKETES